MCAPSGYHYFRWFPPWTPLNPRSRAHQPPVHATMLADDFLMQFDCELMSTINSVLTNGTQPPLDCAWSHVNASQAGACRGANADYKR